MQQHELIGHIDLDRVLGKAVAAALQCRIDEVRRLRPFELHLQAVAADARSVQDVLDLHIEALRLVMDHHGERHQTRIGGDFGRGRQHRRGAEDRRQRRAQLVRHRSDQRFAELLGLGPHARIGDGAREPEPLQRGRRIVDHRHHAGSQIVETVGLAAEIDRDDAEIRGVDRDRTNQPGAAAAVIDDDSLRAPGVRHLGPPDRLGHRLGNVDIIEALGFVIQATPRIEQQDLAADECLQMALHGIEDAGRRVGGR